MKFLIVGNIGSGKSTLARALAERSGLPVLELDGLLQGGDAPRPEPATVRTQLEGFCNASRDWIVAGTAGHLVQATLAWQPELLFLNPGPEVCLRNCRERSLDSRSPSQRLPEQLQRVADYYRRDGDENSLHTHRAIYDNYQGPKRELVLPLRLRVADVIWPARPVTRE
jgi:adenylate kinase family enzyme